MQIIEDVNGGQSLESIMISLIIVKALKVKVSKSLLRLITYFLGTVELCDRLLE
jgi:hypothetical protein